MRFWSRLIILVVCFGNMGNMNAQYNFNVKRPLREISHKIVYASYSPDGKYIVTAGSDSSIIIWNVDRLTIYRTLTGLKARPNVAVFSPNDDFVLAGGRDNNVTMWDLGIMPPAIVSTFAGHRGQVKSIDVSPDGKYLASGSADETIRIWDIQTANLIYELKGHKKEVNSVKFGPDGKTLVSGGEDGTLIIWNVDNGSMIRSLPDHKGIIRDIAISKDGNLIASCADDKLINIRQMQGFNKVATLEGHKDWIQSIDFSPDGKTLISGARDKLIILWDVATQKILRQSDKQQQIVTCVDISPVRSDFISSCFDSEDLEIWALSGMDESQWKTSVSPVIQSLITNNEISDDKQNVREDQLLDNGTDKEVLIQASTMIELFSPVFEGGRFQSDKNNIILIGRVSDPEGIKGFLINGRIVNLADGGIFQYSTTLTKGDNFLDLVAFNNKGKMNEQKVIIDCTAADAYEEGETPSEISRGRYIGLLIGINNYLDPDIPDLENPVNDAGSLYNILVSEYTFEKRNMRLLIDPTYRELIGTLDSLTRNLTPDDNLLIFYAGHGIWDDRGKVGSWFPSDASKTNTSNWFRNSILRDYLGSIDARHTLLIADACFSGAIFKTRAISMEPSQGIEKLYKLPSRKAMTSGILQEVPDESAFLKYLVRRLADNEEKYLTSESLFSSFKTAVMDNSPNVPQFGVIQNVGDEGGDFIFIRR